MHDGGFSCDAGHQRVGNTVVPDIVLVVEQAESGGERRLQRKSQRTPRSLSVHCDNRVGAVWGVPVVPRTNGSDHGAHATVYVQQSDTSRIS